MWRLGSRELVGDRISSHIHAGVRPLLEEALTHFYSGNWQRKSLLVDFGREIGMNSCVETESDDQIVYARLMGRETRNPLLKRFVLGRNPIPTSHLAVAVKRGNQQLYYVVTAYFSDPKTHRRELTSYDFWSFNALCWGSEPVKCFLCRHQADVEEVIGEVAFCQSCASRVKEQGYRLLSVALGKWKGVKVPRIIVKPS